MCWDAERSTKNQNPTGTQSLCMTCPVTDTQPVSRIESRGGRHHGWCQPMACEPIFTHSLLQGLGGLGDDPLIGFAWELVLVMEDLPTRQRWQRRCCVGSQGERVLELSSADDLQAGHGHGRCTRGCFVVRQCHTGWSKCLGDGTEQGNVEKA